MTTTKMKSTTIKSWRIYQNLHVAECPTRCSHYERERSVKHKSSTVLAIMLIRNLIRTQRQLITHVGLQYGLSRRQRAFSRSPVALDPWRATCWHLLAPKHDRPTNCLTDIPTDRPIDRLQQQSCYHERHVYAVHTLVWCSRVLRDERDFCIERLRMDLLFLALISIRSTAGTAAAIKPDCSEIAAAAEYFQQ